MDLLFSYQNVLRLANACSCFVPTLCCFLPSYLDLNNWIYFYFCWWLRYWGSIRNHKSLVLFLYIIFWTIHNAWVFSNYSVSLLTLDQLSGWIYNKSQVVKVTNGHMVGLKCFVGDRCILSDSVTKWWNEHHCFCSSSLKPQKDWHKHSLLKSMEVLLQVGKISPFQLQMEPSWS